MVIVVRSLPANVFSLSTLAGRTLDISRH